MLTLQGKRYVMKEDKSEKRERADIKEVRRQEGIGHLGRKRRGGRKPWCQ